MTAAERGQALLSWHRSVNRSLPGRGDCDPYRVLVAETMLQQTQAARVAPIYADFLCRFPTVADLAGAPLRDVLAAWSGLGYNQRARRLRAAAQGIVVSGWPTTVAGLQELPGVGPYTAAAVACFAFGADVAVVDTNVRRVLSRWHGRPLTGATLAAAAEADKLDDARTWNEALMDLGALVCRGPNPSCRSCPVARWCPGPEGYVPPPRQPPFAGSSRQARGVAVRALVADAPLDSDELAARMGLPIRTAHPVLAGLEEDGMIRRTAAGWEIPGG